MATGKTLQCVVVTPEKAVLDTTTNFVAVPMYDGELGILSDRAPLIGRLGVGELRIGQGESARSYFIDGGFVQVRANVVTILTAKAIKAEEIDVTAARRTLSPEQPAIKNVREQETRIKNKERARVQLRVAKAR